MSELVNVNYNTSLQVQLPQGGNSSIPSNSVLQFQAKNRIVEHVRQIAGNNGTFVFDPVLEGFTSVDLFIVKVETVNKTLIMKFNSDSVGLTIKPVLPSGNASFIATANFSTVTMVNPDAGAITINITVFERAAS